MNMDKLITEDGSPTFFNRELGEHYHSTLGAIAEARQKHADPANIIERYKNNGFHIRILDFAFGLGYNSAAALDYLIKNGYEQPNLHITALENDRSILDKIKEISPEFSGYELIKNFADSISVYKQFIQPMIFQHQKIQIELYLEDALERIKYLNNNFYDVIFFDPFSRPRTPVLWSKKVFEILHKKLKTGGCLTTYSCAKRFRKDIADVGFIWKEVPPGFEKKPSTIAFKN